MDKKTLQYRFVACVLALVALLIYEGAQLETVVLVLSFAAILLTVGVLYFGYKLFFEKPAA